ncbi:MAG: hypothetical protein EA398_17575 [Deltaproteobacteria bacterium]|nr:MAG: hypothetical protein EA398_17575 [Deltaproteobacteria bacterium]
MPTSTPRNARLLRIAGILCAALAAGTGCALLDDFSTDCEPLAQEHTETVAQAANLLGAIPDGTERFPMALVLNQAAVNAFFANLSDSDLGELTDGVSVLGQQVNVSVRPRLPQLRIGGERGCPECFVADVPFDVGVFLNRNQGPRGTGRIRLQLPVGMRPLDDDRSAFVAAFQNAEILELDIEALSSLSPVLYGAVEPLVSTLLTSYLQNRFNDVEIATFRSWRIGRGDVRLAGRGPLVFPESRAVVIALQTNLPLPETASLAARAELPPGADVGLIFDPNLLGAMARRMNYEGEIPSTYNASGAVDEAGGNRIAFRSFEAGADDTLDARMTLWRTNNLCGAMDIRAAVGLSAAPEGVRFSVRDVRYENTRGSATALERFDALSGGLMDTVLNTLDLTVNYDGLLVGEAENTMPVETLQASIDGRGLRVFFNLGGD